MCAKFLPPTFSARSRYAVLSSASGSASPTLRTSLHFAIAGKATTDISRWQPPCRKGHAFVPRVSLRLQGGHFLQDVSGVSHHHENVRNRPQGWTSGGP